MKELHSDTLKSALRNLRAYQPGNDLWDKISMELNEDAQVDNFSDTQGLKQAIRGLPVYQAPAAVWNQLQLKLNLRTKRNLYLRLTAIAASLVLLVTTLIYLMNQYPEKPTGPIAEKEATRVPLTSAEIAEYENQMAKEEESLQDCLAKNRSVHDEGIEAAVQKLNELTATRDSLSILLKAGNSLPGTSPRLNRLEQRRKQIILELHEQLCESEQ